VNALLTTALSYADRGWPVFPLHGIVGGRCTCGRCDCSSPGKHPLVRRGLKEAVTEARVIKEWGSRWPHANIGMCTGSASGLVVIDVDLPRAFESLDRLLHKLPRTLTGLTGGGGVHLLLRAPGDHSLHNRASRLPGIPGKLPGIDLRADGGYIVAPPSRHISGARYEWLNLSVPIAPAPEWLREPERNPRPIAECPPRFSTGDGTAYGLTVLRNQLDTLRCAQVGERNHTLNRCAFIVALNFRAGHLAETPARRALQDVALAIGLTDWEISGTLASAFRAALPT
jgi:hypothetical protein